ncbi:MAG TPA: hypothetical protein VH598_01295, partial [Verrucomicrobiae bacterium]|nr:hypothetical protein [Verrucomicrobiae bacterium]
MDFLPLFADTLTPPDTLPGLRGAWVAPELRSRLIMVLAILIAISIPVIWAVYFRKKPRHRKHHHHHVPSVSAEPGAVTESPARFKRRKKRRRSSHPNRALNPTLAETGGLPPIRGKDHPG